MSRTIKLSKLFKRKLSLPSLLMLLALAIGGIVTIDMFPLDTLSDSSGQVLSSASQSAHVVKVVDGDTVRVSVDGEEKVVRLIGIDTPESVHPQKPVECFAKEASAKLEELILGKDVVLESDPTQGDQDKYGRLLRYIILDDGSETNVNEMMIAEGFAFEYTYGEPYAYRDEFIEAQEKAEWNDVGLWDEDVCSY